MEWSKDDEKNLKRLLSAANDEASAFIEKMVNEMRTLMVYYRCAIMEVETKLNVLNEEYSLKHDRNPINSIKTRLTSFVSIKEKMQSRGVRPTPDNIEKTLNDIAGVRVICSFLDDVYTVADALLKQDDVTLIQKKDYIQNPKPNGYRSLHLIVEVPIFLQNEKRMVKVEIQLRTIAMDFWASLEHDLKYKKEIPDVDEIQQELKECAETIADTDRRMMEIRDRIELSHQELKIDGTDYVS